jgi:hypothetical protein
VGEQRRLSDWADVQAYELSAFVTSEDKLQSAKWMASVQRADLERAEFRGINLWQVCRNEFAQQTGLDALDDLSALHEQLLRELYVAFVQAAVAADRFVVQWAPTLSFVAHTSDSMTHAYLSQLGEKAIDCATFMYDGAEESIIVESAKSQERYASKLILDSITSMRSDPRTWAPEVRAIVNEIMSFLGYGADRVV